MNVLVVAPHRDDEVLGCGGTIAKHVKSGDTVSLCVVTTGLASLFSAEMLQETDDQMRESCAYLGISQIFSLNFPAPRTDLEPKHRVADEIRKVILETKAETIYLPHPGDLHFEHAIVFRAGLVAGRPVPGSPVKNIYVYETLSETDWAPAMPHEAFLPTRFVDITDTLEDKIAAMGKYKAQLKPAPSARSLESLRALATLRGGTVGVLAAEAFMVMREIA